MKSRTIIALVATLGTPGLFGAATNNESVDSLFFSFAKDLGLNDSSTLPLKRNTAMLGLLPHD